MGLISVSVSRPGIEQRFDGFPLRMREGKQTSHGFPKLEKTLSTQLYHGLFSKRSSSVAYQSLFYPMIDLLMTIRSRLHHLFMSQIVFILKSAPVIQKKAHYRQMRGT